MNFQKHLFGKATAASSAADDDDGFVQLTPFRGSEWIRSTGR